MQKNYEKRREKIANLKDYPDFWLRVLSNHRVIKDFISDEDRNILKFLKDIRYEKYEDGMVFIYLFILKFNNILEF